ncbi:MAG: TIGR04255 family protein [Bradymonadaceae bacterium]|nr:TIGR04255 family protein [Lujinxingiaceae bacterium]
MVGFFEAVDYVDLPLYRLSNLFPNRAVQPVSEIGERLNSGEIGPLYGLVNEDDESHVIFAGHNAVGVSALNYQSWPSFKKRALDDLVLCQKAYGDRPFEAFLLRYVDVFQAPTLVDLAGVLRTIEPLVRSATNLCDMTATFHEETCLGEVDTQTTIRYSMGLERADADNVPSNYIAVVRFDVLGERPITAKQWSEPSKLSWFDDAHRRQKRLLWNALTEEYKKESGLRLFDEEEVEQFSQAEL